MKGARLAVVGAGTMGHGIAYAAALAGLPVALTDSQPQALERARHHVHDLVAGAVRRGTLTEAAARTVEHRFTFCDDLASAVRTADVVIEAIIERLPAKQALFAELDRLAPAAALLATNTSSLSVVRIADAVREPGRVLGLHFFNPVHRMRLVEVVRHDRLLPEILDRAVALAHTLGKEPIVVRDAPGFASSRLGVVLGLEAMRMVEQGVASPEDIDKAMELGYNHPMGPLKLTDLVGLDVRLAIADYLHQELGSPHYAPPQILRDKVARGELGKKTGKGFYTWTS